MAAPIFIGSAVANFATQKAVGVASANTSTTFAVLAGDVIVALSAGEDTVATAALTASDSNSNAYTERGQRLTGSHCVVDISTATAAANASLTGTVTRASTADAQYFGSAFCVFRSSSGLGNVLSVDAQTGSLTTTQDNSAVALVIADWAATSPAGKTWPSINGAQPVEVVPLAQQVNKYSYVVAYYAGVGLAGPKTIELTAPALGTPSMLAIEVKGSSSAASAGSRGRRRKIRRSRSAENFTSGFGIGQQQAVQWFDPALRFPAGGGGGVTANATDSVTFSDSAVSITNRLSVATDSVTFSDSAVSITNRLSVATDSVTFSDSATAATAQAAVASDTVSFSDSAVSITTRLSVATDSVTFSDSAVATRDGGSRSVTAVDTVSFSDSAESITTRIAVASDGVTFGDSATVVVQIVAVAVDSVAFSDSATALVNAAATALDSIAFSDSAVSTTTRVATATDAVAFSDSADSLTTRVATAIDTLTFSDSAEALKTLSRLATAVDSITFTDQATATVVQAAIVTPIERARGSGGQTARRLRLERLDREEREVQTVIMVLVHSGVLDG